MQLICQMLVTCNNALCPAGSRGWNKPKLSCAVTGGGSGLKVTGLYLGVKPRRSATQAQAISHRVQQIAYQYFCLDGCRVFFTTNADMSATCNACCTRTVSVCEHCRGSMLESLMHSPSLTNGPAASKPNKILEAACQLASSPGKLLPRRCWACLLQAQLPGPHQQYHHHPNSHKGASGSGSDRASVVAAVPTTSNKAFVAGGRHSSNHRSS